MSYFSEISLLVFWFMHFYKKYVPLTFCSQLLLFLTPMRTKFPSASSLSFFLILFLISFIQILSTFLIQDLFYFLCQQIISEYPAYALSCDPAPCKLLDPPIQVQLPHVEPYDHQIKYNFYRRMAVTVLCIVVRLQLVEPILFDIPPAVHHLP